MSSRNHVIRETETGFELVTWTGYILKRFDTREEAEAYYRWHCPKR